MNSKKTIFKSLLMIVALSFAVSCSKDEDGGTKTPTNPTTQSISATQLTETIKGLGQLKDTDNAVILDFSSIAPANGTAKIEKANQSFAKVKTALQNAASATWTGVTVTTDLTDSTTKPSGSGALTVNLTFTANSGFAFDTTITGGTDYTYDKAAKTAKLELSITPSASWTD